MNIQQIRNAQNALRAAIAICEAKGGLVSAANVANQAWIDAGEPYPLPVGEYRRYSWLIADLTRMQMQMAEALRDAELDAGLPVDEETGADLREWCGNDIEAAHAEALEVNAIVDNAVQVATCYSSLDSCTHNAICKAIDITRRSLLALNRYNPRFIVKMMISVTRQAKEARKAAAVRYQEMLARCAASDAGYNEIPF